MYPLVCVSQCVLRAAGKAGKRGKFRLSDSDAQTWLEMQLVCDRAVWVLLICEGDMEVGNYCQLVWFVYHFSFVFVFLNREKMEYHIATYAENSKLFLYVLKLICKQDSKVRE